MQHQFFHGFVPQQEMVKSNVNTTPELEHNLMVFEIHNNWTHVQSLVKRALEVGEIQVDPMERDWLEFINKNKIDMISFENEDDFVDKHLQALVNEK